MNDVEKLAKELLIARVNAYSVAQIGQNAGAYVGAAAIAQWYPQCLAVAEAIEKATEVKPGEGAVFIPDM